MNNEPHEKMTPAMWLLRLVQGAFIGGGAILPGISGGVLCVSFGIYRPMMALLAHPIKTIGKYYRLFIPVIIGWAAGFMFFAKLIEVMFGASETISTWLFIGLIVGTVPSLVRESSAEPRTKGSWTALIISFALMLGMFIALRFAASVSVSAGWASFLFCGVLWGLSLIIPGLSSSSLLIFLGLYEPMASGIAGLDLIVVVPMLVGIIAVVLALAKLVNRLFAKHFSIAYHAVLGFVAASTLVIVPTEYISVLEAALCLLAAAIGFFIAWLMDKWGQKNTD